MGQWVLTVAGIAVLSVLCDIVLPQGQTRKYVKTVMGVVITFAIVQPLFGFLGGDITVSDSFTTPALQQQYLDNAENRAQAEIADKAALSLRANGICVRDVTVSDGEVTVRAEGVPSAETEARIAAIAGVFFPNSPINTVWV